MIRLLMTAAAGIAAAMSVAQAQPADLDERACSAEGRLWLQDQCTFLPAEIIGEWQYAGAAYVPASEIYPFHPSYSFYQRKLTITASRGAVVARSEAPLRRMATVLLGNENLPPGQFAVANGFVTYAEYLRSPAVRSHPAFEALRNYKNYGIPDDEEFLVFQIQGAGYMFFVRKEPPRGQWPEGYRSSEGAGVGGNACLYIWGIPDRNEFTDRLSKCLEPENLDKWSFYSDGNNSPFAVLVRTMFRKLTGKRYFRDCLMDEACDFEASLAEAISMATLRGVLIYDHDDYENMQGLLATRIALTKEFDRARLAVFAGTEQLHRDLEFVVDSLSVDGTESLLKPVGYNEEDRVRIRETNLAFTKAVTMNVGCTLLGLAPGIGPTVSLTCGGVGVSDAVNAFHARRDGERFPDIERTPTVLNLKQYNQAVVSETRQLLLHAIDRLELLSYEDTNLADQILRAGIAERLSTPPDERLKSRKVFWEETLGVMGFLKPKNVRYVMLGSFEKRSRQYCERGPDRGPGQGLVKAGARVASSTLLVLNEGLFGISEAPNPPKDPTLIPSKFRPSKYTPRAYAPAPQSDPLDIPMYDPDRLQAMDWELHVGRFAESRPLGKKALEDLRQFFSNEELYKIARGRSYFMANQHVRRIPADDQEQDAFDDPPTVRIRKAKTTAYLQRTADMPTWDKPIDFGVYAGFPVNPGSDKKTWGVGPEVKESICYY